MNDNNLDLRIGLFFHPFKDVTDELMTVFQVLLVDFISIMR